MLWFKNNRLVLLGLLVMIVLAVMYTHNSREHLSVNKDSSTNWDKPELSSSPAPTPAAEDVASLKKRLSALEDQVRQLKSKVN